MTHYFEIEYCDSYLRFHLSLRVCDSSLRGCGAAIAVYTAVGMHMTVSLWIQFYLFRPRLHCMLDVGQHTLCGIQWRLHTLMSPPTVAL